jgi:hypothetical protein
VSWTTRSDEFFLACVSELVFSNAHAYKSAIRLVACITLYMSFAHCTDVRRACMSDTFSASNFRISSSFFCRSRASAMLFSRSFANSAELFPALAMACLTCLRETKKRAPSAASWTKNSHGWKCMRTKLQALHAYHTRAVTWLYFIIEVARANGSTALLLRSGTFMDNEGFFFFCITNHEPAVG